MVGVACCCIVPLSRVAPVLFTVFSALVPFVPLVLFCPLRVIPASPLSCGVMFVVSGEVWWCVQCCCCRAVLCNTVVCGGVCSVLLWWCVLSHVNGYILLSLSPFLCSLSQHCWFRVVSL